MSDFLNSFFHHSEENIFGGQNYYDDQGHMIAHSQDNIFGGHDIYDTQNHSIGQTHENVFDGMDVFDDQGHLEMRTMEGSLGDTVIGDDGHVLGSIHHTADGGSFQDIHGAHTSWQENILGGYTMDPLFNTGSIMFPELL